MDANEKFWFQSNLESSSNPTSRHRAKGSKRFIAIIAWRRFPSLFTCPENRARFPIITPQWCWSWINWQVSSLPSNNSKRLDYNSLLVLCVWKFCTRLWHFFMTSTSLLLSLATGVVLCAREHDMHRMQYYFDVVLSFHAHCTLQVGKSNGLEEKLEQTVSHIPGLSFVGLISLLAHDQQPIATPFLVTAQLHFYTVGVLYQSLNSTAFHFKFQLQFIFSLNWELERWLKTTVTRNLLKETFSHYLFFFHEKKHKRWWQRVLNWTRPTDNWTKPNHQHCSRGMDTWPTHSQCGWRFVFVLNGYFCCMHTTNSKHDAATPPKPVLPFIHYIPPQSAGPWMGLLFLRPISHIFKKTETAIRARRHLLHT